METIVASLISGIVAIVVCVINSRAQMNELAHKLEVSQAVTDTKLDELTREVRQHNEFGKRIPVLEEKISVANHRIDDLERGDDRK